MSAYICDFYHISALAVAIHRHLETGEKPGDIAQLLYEENCKSVAFRYQDIEPPEPFIFDRRALISIHRPVELIKAAHCYDYQACEHPTWEDSRAHALIHRLLNRLIRQIPGYEQAEWGLQPPGTARIAQNQ
jgi:hypothetical protein